MKKGKKKKKKSQCGCPRGVFDVKDFNYDCLASLDHVISNFILPRLKKFKEVTVSTPFNMTGKEWDKKLDKMIYAFEWAAKGGWDIPEEEWGKVRKGLKLFAKYYFDLWI